MRTTTRLQRFHPLQHKILKRQRRREGGVKPGSEAGTFDDIRNRPTGGREGSELQLTDTRERQIFFAPACAICALWNASCAGPTQWPMQLAIAEGGQRIWARQRVQYLMDTSHFLSPRRLGPIFKTELVCSESAKIGADSVRPHPCGPHS